MSTLFSRFLDSAQNQTVKIFQTVIGREWCDVWTFSDKAVLTWTTPVWKLPTGFFHSDDRQVENALCVFDTGYF